MKVFQLELSPAALRDLKSLPVKIQRKIALEHLPKIREIPYQVGKPLSGALHKERSYHFWSRPDERRHL